jgi:ribosomal 50S subunit-associated protein YjgA (DUF615 family)
LQYVGKLMRFANVDVIAAELDLSSAKNRAEVGLDHAAERWRSRILDEADGLTLWNESFSAAPITAELVATLNHDSNKNSVEGKRKFRDLFRFIKKAISDKQLESSSL